MDRIESGWAVLRVEEVGEWLLPAELLPEVPREAMHLRITLEADSEAEESTRERVAELQRRLRDASREEGRA